MMISSELLFFDTFSHDAGEELNLDLVQFPSPVIVDEVRVIPLGARVQANFPGGVRLGATNPTEFDLEFFVNDLTKPGSSTFESLGVLPYRNDGKINLGTDKKIPTDGLVLRGLYNAITLAVYGTFSKSTPEQLALQGSRDENLPLNGDEKPPRSPPPPPPPPPPHPAKQSVSPPKRSLSPRPPSRRQSAESMLDDMSDISEGDIPDAEDYCYEGGGGSSSGGGGVSRRFVKEIEELSDDEAVEWSDNELTHVGGGEYFEDEEEDPVKPFDPLDCPLTGPLKYFRLFKDPPSPEGAPLSDSDWDKLSSGDINSTGEWVEHVETVTRNIIEVLRAEEDYRPRLLRYAEVGLDLDKALTQSMPTFKVRHIKSGLKLILALVLCGGEFVEELIAIDIYDKLLYLFREQYMAISLRLLILRIMDLLMNYAVGMDNFLTKAYEEVVRLCLSKQSTRSKFALSALACKAHLNEVLERLGDCSQDSEEEVLAILDEIMDNYKSSKLRIAQSERFLPVKSHYELSQEMFNGPHAGFFSLLRNNGTLYSFLVLLTNPKTSPCIAVTVHRLLDIFSQSQEGLIFLADESDVTNRIIEILLRTDCPSLAEKLAYRIQGFALLDELYDACRDKVSRRDCESSEVLTAIQDLYGLTFDDHRGKLSLADVLGFEDNLEILLRLARHESERDLKKSAIRGYACELLFVVVKAREDVSHLKKFASSLIDLAKSDENSRLYELVSWLNPLEEVFRSFSKEENTEDNEDDDDDEIVISRLCDVVKKSIEPLNPISPSLITSIRLLMQYLVDDDDDDAIEQHKNKYHLVTAFSKDLYEHFLTILGKVFSMYEQPHLHVSTFSSNQNGLLLISLLCPLVRTLKHLLRFVIECRGVEFQDLRPISILMKTYGLTLAFPRDSLCNSFGKRIRQDILHTVLAFTQPTFDLSKHNMADSLWKKTIKEIIDFTLQAPQTYYAGIRMLAEILPLPLPIESSSPLEREDEKNIVNLRKLWSGHLFPLESSIAELVAFISGCSSIELLRLFKKVCVQISDLSCHSAMMVAKALIDSLRKNEEDIMTLRQSLLFLEDTLDNPAVKSSFLSLVADEEKGVYEIFQKLLVSESRSVHLVVLRIYTRLCDSKVTLVPSNKKENLFNGLPTKAQMNSILSMSVEYLVSCQEPLEDPLLETILENFHGLSTHEYGFYFLRTAFFRAPTAMKTIFKILSERFEGPRVSLWLATLKNMTTGQSHLTSQELAHLLQWKSDDENHPLKSLKAQLSRNEGNEEWTQMAKELDTFTRHLPSSTDFNDDHAIKLSLSLLCDNDPSFETPDSVSSQFESRKVWVSGENAKTRSNDFNRDSFDELENDEEDGVSVSIFEFAEKCLPKDFDFRKELDLLYGDEEETVAKKKKFHHPSSSIKKSLLETKTLENRSMIANLKAGTPVPINRQNNGNTSGNVNTNNNSNSASTNNSNNNSGGGNNNNNRFSRSGQRIDAFRSRPPNTSRPPSLHVDDFLVLQSRGQQPTGPTGYNKQSVKAAKELFAQREAAQNKNSIVGYREATDKPVYPEQRNNGILSGSSGSGGNESRRSNRSGSGSNRSRGGTSERSDNRNRAGSGNSSSGNRGSSFRSSGTNDRSRDRNSGGRYSPRYSPLPSRDYRDESDRRFGNGNSRRGGSSGNSSWGSGNSDRNSRTKDRFVGSGSRNGSRSRDDSRQRHMRSLAR